jgi:hypothetical protein
MRDTIPGESRLFIYFSLCLLRELQVALQLVGVRSRVEPTGEVGDEPPQLVIEDPAFGRPHEVLCALPQELAGHNADWWFEWCQWDDDRRERFCLAIDMKRAARLVAAHLRKWS